MQYAVMIDHFECYKIDLGSTEVPLHTNTHSIPCNRDTELVARLCDNMDEHGESV